MEVLKKGQIKLNEELSSLNRQVAKNSNAIKTCQEKTDKSLELTEKSEGQIYEIRNQLDRLEAAYREQERKPGNTRDRLLSLERHSREFNLRFYNIPESPREDCFSKLQDILLTDLNFQPEIENAHRIGRLRMEGSPRPIIAKFLYRPERARVQKNRKNLRSGVWISEDLIWEDQQKKKELREVMKEAYTRGQKPRFQQGTLYIDGQKYRE